MPAYLVAQFVLKDAAWMEKYASRVAQVVTDFGGRVLFRAPVRGVPVGSSRADIVATIAFEDEDTIARFLASDAYRMLVPLRDLAAEATFLTLAAGP
jgi:uncharacterized protein (DUF1330 family)